MPWFRKTRQVETIIPRAELRTKPSTRSSWYQDSTQGDRYQLRMLMQGSKRHQPKGAAAEQTEQRREMLSSPLGMRGMYTTYL